MDEEIARGVDRQLRNLREVVCAELQIHVQKASVDRTAENLHAKIRRVNASIHPAVEPHKKFG